VCCSVLQCVAVCCSLLQCVAMHVAVCCSVRSSVHSSVLQDQIGLGWIGNAGVFVCCSVWCSVLHCTAVCCIVLQCVVTWFRLVAACGGELLCVAVRGAVYCSVGG